MKHTLGVVTLVILAFFFLHGCSKRDNASSASSKTKTGTLTLSLAKVQKSQPLIASLAASTATSVRWTVTPAPATAHVMSSKGQATILFAQPGTYRITATALAADSSGVDSTSGTVSVSDTVYTPPASSDTSSLAGDQVTIKPLVDSIGNLILLAQTARSYGCSSSIVYGITSGPNGSTGLGINLYEVVSSGTGDCNGAQNPASVYLFPNYGTLQWSNGTWPLTVTLSGVAYTGSITVTNSGYSFNWGYTSGVIISPLQINK